MLETRAIQGIDSSFVEKHRGGDQIRVEIDVSTRAAINASRSFADSGLAAGEMDLQDPQLGGLVDDPAPLVRSRARRCPVREFQMGSSNIRSGADSGATARAALRWEARSCAHETAIGEIL